MSADYSQIELRVLAHLADDAALIVPSPAGTTSTRAPAADVFGALAPADGGGSPKVINYGIVYGMGRHGPLASSVSP